MLIKIHYLLVMKSTGTAIIRTVRELATHRRSIVYRPTWNILNQRLFSTASSDNNEPRSFLEGDEDFEELIKDNIHKFGLPSRKERHETYKFVDKVFIEVRGGRGGNGCISFDATESGSKKPSGGNGGKGGDVYVVADKSMTSLEFKTFHFNGGHGQHGQGEGMTGRNGKDAVIRVPLGTILTERYPDEDNEINKNTPMEFNSEEERLEWEWYLEQCGDEENGEPRATVELDRDQQTVMVAEGGQPGVGNKAMKGTAFRKTRSVPRHKIPGNEGELRWLKLELKLIADVGLIGFPNAGKSSLLRALSNAKPKVAPYPFTTLHPMVGTVEYSDTGRITVADIPGIIEGASANRGLGLDFLRHIERTQVMLYVVDAAATENRSPVADLKCLVDEVTKYDQSLALRPSLVLGNKFDLKVDGRHLNALKRYTESLGWTFYEGSAESGLGIGQLANELRRIIDELKRKNNEKSKKRQMPNNRRTVNKQD